MPRDHRASPFLFTMIVTLLLSGCAAVKPQTGIVPEAEGGDGGRSLSGSLAYFPARRGSVSTGVSGSPHGAGVPGYGIYTFVLLGEGGARMDDTDRERYRELLRLVQSYVLALEDSTLGPVSARHAFVVPVPLGGREESLMHQADPALSTNMRIALAEYFDQTSRPSLAQRLLDHPGPFLISSLEPQLVSGSTRAPRMVADLSGVGSEYMYAVIDAYDRRIPGDMVGEAVSFEPIRERLLDLFTLVAGTGAGGRGDDQFQVQVTGVSASASTPRKAAEPTN